MNNFEESPITRRRWLQQAAFLGLSSTILGRSSMGEVAPETPRVTFGFSLYGMNSLPLSKAILTIAKIGYDATEIVCTKGWDTAPERFAQKDRVEARKLLEGEGLQLPGLMENLPLIVDPKVRGEHLERIKRAGDLGHELSPDSPPVLETVLGGKSSDWLMVKQQMVEELGRWSEAAESVRTVVAVKPHVGGSVWKPEFADWLVRQVDSPWIRLVYDYSHYHVHNFDLTDSMKLLLPNTVFIHVKDEMGRDGKAQFVLPGEGDTDYKAYFTTLKESKYSGTVMVEVSSHLWRQNGYDPERAAEQSFSNLKPSLVELNLWKGRSG